MSHLTSHPFGARPARLNRPRRPRRRFLATLSAVAGSALSPGGAAAHGGAPALHAGEIQERLIALGVLPADARTGRYDRRTMDAVARFQASQGLPVDGLADAATADALLGAAETFKTDGRHWRHG
jgi:peptidoglycan hydrolase-like protein with peptidoglycan-binding domain